MNKLSLNVLLPSVFLLAFISLNLSTLTAQNKQESKAVTIEKATFTHAGNGNWNVAVTLLSEDSGWDYYADGWQVIDAQTNVVYGERSLAHPHTTEQPFTRSTTLNIPSNITEVKVVAKMSTDKKYPTTGLAVNLSQTATLDNGKITIKR